jgi:hypothetical protein
MLQHDIEELFEDIHPNWKKKLVEDSDPCIVDLTDLIPPESRFVAINTLHNKRAVVFERLTCVRGCVLEAKRMVTVIREAKCGINVIREAEYELEVMRRAEGEVNALVNQYTTAISLLLFKRAD